MSADLQVSAKLRLDEILNFVVTLPGALFLRRIVNLADEIRVQARIAFLPQKNAIGWQAVASCAARFLVILFNRFQQREMNDGAHGGFVDAHAEGERSRQARDV